MRPRPTTKSKHDRMLDLTKNHVPKMGWEGLGTKAHAQMHCNHRNMYSKYRCGCGSSWRRVPFSPPFLRQATIAEAHHVVVHIRDAGHAAGAADHAAAAGRRALGRHRPCSWPCGAHDGSRAAGSQRRLPVPRLLPRLPGLPGLLHAFARRHLRYRQCVAKGACHCLWPPRSNQ